MYLSGTKYTALALGCVLSLSATAKNVVPTAGQGCSKPLCFIENKGQLTDAKGKAVSGIQYELSTAGMNLYMGNGALHYQFRKVSEQGDKPLINSYMMNVSLVGANKNARVEVSDALSYYEQYYTAGANGVTAHAYGKITYKDVYPGIDWVLYVKNGTVEYDFVVQPGADASQIKLKYDGATALKMMEHGGIMAVTPMGNISEQKPIAYESNTGKAVAANFKLKNNILSFETGKHDGKLTIDPVIFWSTYFGGTSEDVATCVKVSPGGNIYIGGYTSSTLLNFTIGMPAMSFQPALGGGFDAFITKYDQNGVRQFTTYYGGAGNERGTCIAGDAAFGNIFLGGSTQGSTGMATGGAYRATNSGSIDGFLLRINNNGVRQWSTYYGGTGNDYVNGIAVDGATGVYITGRTESASLISSAGVFQTTLSGSADAFVAKFNGTSGTGTLAFSTYYGGTGVEEGYTVTTDAANNVYVGGQTTSVTNIATAGAYQSTLDGANDGFLGRLNTTGTTRSWGTYFGGPGTDQVTQIVCRAATSDIGITGYTTSTSGIASANAQQTTYGGGAQDAFIGQFTNAGLRTWSSYVGGNDLDYSESITLDPVGNLIIAGGTQSLNNIGTPGSLQPTAGGNFDAFSAKYVAATGQKIWGSYFGNTLNDHAFGVICDGAGQIIMAGRTSSTVGISTATASQLAFAGGTYDAFLTKFRADTFALINQPYTDTLICAGGTLTLPYTVNANFRAGNVFTAQLSNASGSFAAPVNIGTLVSSTSGTISCTIPIGMPAGTGYRIRIVGSAPSYISPDNFRNITLVASLPAVTITSNSPVCVGNTLTLSGTATWAIATYVWTGPGGFIAPGSSTTRPTMTLADAGIYSLTTTHNGCPNNVSTVNVLVNSTIPTSPTADASVLNCNGGTLYLFADSSIVSPDTYDWTGPAGYTATGQTPTRGPLTAADGGTYSVTRTVDGCPSVATIVTVTVTPNSVTGITINVSPNDTICGGTFVTFGSVPLNAGTSPLYQWMVNSLPVVGALSPTWSTSTLSDGDIVSCSMTSNALCPAPATAVSNDIVMNVITNELMVYIFANPGVSVNPGDSIVFTSSVYNAGVGATYQWKRNGNDIPGATNNKYTKYNVTVYDTITLEVTSIMACVSPAIKTSSALVVHPNTSVADVAASISNVELFPNPNTGLFTLKCEMSGIDVSELSISVVNAVGQVMHQETATLTNGSLNKALKINELVPGVYMLQLNAEGTSKTIRFSVQR